MDANQKLGEFVSRIIVAFVWFSAVAATGCGSDGSVPNVDAARGSVDGPVGGAKRVFVTSTGSTGNLGGLVGADANCQQLADAAGLGGTWIAWLSSPTADAIDRLNSSGPWHLVTGERVFASKVAVIDINGGPEVGVNRDENGALVDIAERVWTATQIRGTYFPAVQTACQVWTTNAADDMAAVGEVGGLGPRWTEVAIADCSESTYRLNCFEL